MTTEAVNERVRTYIKENFLYARPRFRLGDDVDLFRNGILDSMGVMELMEFLEEAFGIVIADDDITEENLGTVSAIGRYLSERQERDGAVGSPITPQSAPYAPGKRSTVAQSVAAHRVDT